MREVNVETAADYLRETGQVARGVPVRVRELGGGVSNVVLRVDVQGRPPFVLKQSREQLRTTAAWFSRIDRIWIECAAMALLCGMLPEDAVPSIVFTDRENYLFGMTCAPEDSVVWKNELLAGRADPAVARQAGSLLGAMHSRLRGHPALDAQFADLSVFNELRIDPFYRRVAEVHHDLKPTISRLIASMSEGGEKTFVHGDFSPKNMLVHERGLTLVDFETGHAGDPAFDLGFFLSHLLLKAFRKMAAADVYPVLTRAFWQAYEAAAGIRDDLVQRAIRHTGACVLSRIDGKSPVDYLGELDAAESRQFARALLVDPPPDWETLLGLTAQELRRRDP